MHVITARNVNSALPRGVQYLKDHGIQRDSRNGPVLVAPTPVTTVYLKPKEHVLFDRERDANPFFHLIESLWMLAGRDDLKTLTTYVKTMASFSDDGKTVRGAYGMRWRDWFFVPGGEVIDQLPWAIDRLKKDPNDRRVVISMYDAAMDQNATDRGSKDIPCNIVAAPWIDTSGQLSMTVFCRSNDIIWGAYGANAVHFAFLQEYLAAGVGVPMGELYQVSNNYHGYLSTIDKVGEKTDLYMDAGVPTFPLFGSDEGDATHKQFDEDLTLFFDDPATVGIRSHFLRRVACPITLAHAAYRDKSNPDRFKNAFEIIAQCKALDWSIACESWLLRRMKECSSHAS